MQKQSKNWPGVQYPLKDQNVDTQGYSRVWNIPKIKAEYFNLMWGNKKTVTGKKNTLGPVGLKKGENKLCKLTFTKRKTYVELENSNIIP